MSSEGEARTALNLSEVEEVPQQASTTPAAGDGSEVHTEHVEAPGEKPSFKDQVLGYAKVTRGTVLGKAETKEQGKRILDGDASLHKYPLEKK